MDRTFTINSYDMATILQLSIAVEDIISYNGEVQPDLLEEMQSLQPALLKILGKIDTESKSPLHHHPTKSMM